MDVKTFFSKLFGTVEREVKTEINRAKQAVEQAAKQQFKSPQAQTGKPQDAPTDTPRQSQPEPAPQKERTDAEWVAYFREIIATEFGQYGVRENVAVQELAGDANDEFQLYATRPRQAYKAEWGQPYSFVLYDGGTAKGVVMLGKGHSHDSNVKYLIARMYAKKLSVPYINFYTQMPNEREYVVGRIRKFLA